MIWRYDRPASSTLSVACCGLTSFKFHAQIGSHNNERTLLSIKMDVWPYSEISKEIQTRQETERYLSALCESEQDEEVIDIIGALERYRQIGWAAEMTHTYPVNSWQLVLHNRY